MEKHQYQTLAEFRYQIRLFLHFSETAARNVGLEPQQHQLMLAVKGFTGPGEGPTIADIANRLQIKHNSAVELLDRMEERRMILRRRGEADKRQIIVALTTIGDKLLEKLSEDHLAEISQTGPALVKTLESLIAAVAIES